MASSIVVDIHTGTSRRVRTADEIGRALGARADGDLVAISGVDTAQPGGVTAVLRVTGRGTDDSWLEPDWIVEDFCFEVHFGSTYPTTLPTVPCPSPAPRLTFPPSPEPRPPAPDEVRAALLATTADEAGVRAALARLSLDPAVRVDVAMQGTTVGVALRSPVAGGDRYACVFARTGTGTVEVWQPPGEQMQPGELACLATESLAGYRTR